MLRHEVVSGVLWGRQEAVEEEDGDSNLSEEESEEDEDRGQWEGEIRGEGPGRRHQNEAAAQRVREAKEIARRQREEAAPRVVVAALAGEERRGHLVCEVSGTGDIA